jgi:hypothetical protein
VPLECSVLAREDDGRMRLDHNVVFLLGAGASKDAGLPTSFELTRKLADKIGTNGGRQQLAAALNFVCAALLLYDAANHDASPYGDLDAERVFAAVELLARRGDLEVSPFVSA